MKYKFKILVKRSLAYPNEFIVKAKCFKWNFGESIYIDWIQGGEDNLLNYYKNMDINKIIEKIKKEILDTKNAKTTKHSKDIIKQIEKKGNKLIIEI